MLLWNAFHLLHFIPNGAPALQCPTDSKVQDFVVLQVIVLILLICSAATIGWVISGKLDRNSGEPS